MTAHAPKDRPQRFRCSRAKGAKLLPDTIVVARPSRWGNPFDWRADYATWLAIPVGEKAHPAGRRATVVKIHRAWLTRTPIKVIPVGGAPELEYGNGATTSFDQLALNAGINFGGMYLAEAFPKGLPTPPTAEEIRAHLRGKNLACWCALDAPCHADVLIEIANAPEAKAA